MISLHPTQPSHADDIVALLDRSFGPGFRARTAERLREANRPIAALSILRATTKKHLSAVLATGRCAWGGGGAFAGAAGGRCHRAGQGRGPPAHAGNA